MRVKLDTAVFTYRRKFERGGQIEEDESSAFTRNIHYVQRPDVSVVPKNSYWRRPTDYTSVIAFESSPVQGVIIRNRLFDNPTVEAWSETKVGILPEFLSPFISYGNQYPSQNSVNRAETQALLKIRDSKVSVGLAMAEMNKTIDLVADRTMSLYRSYRALRKGNFRKALYEVGIKGKTKGKSAAQLTLEVQYGWTPLMSDIMGGYDEIRRPFRNHGIRLKAKSRVSEHDTDRVNYYNDPEGTFSCIYETDYEKQVQVILWFEVNSPSLLQASSVGLTNPFEIAWELVPFSFLLDWVVPVGNLLSSLTATEGLTFLGGTKTLTGRTKRTAKVIVKPDTRIYGDLPGRFLATGFAVGNFSVFEMDRFTYSEPPNGNIYYKNPISGGHLLNAVALLRSIR